MMCFETYQLKGFQNTGTVSKVVWFLVKNAIARQCFCCRPVVARVFLGARQGPQVLDLTFGACPAVQQASRSLRRSTRDSHRLTAYLGNVLRTLEPLNCDSFVSLRIECVTAEWDKVEKLGASPISACLYCQRLDPSDVDSLFV